MPNQRDLQPGDVYLDEDGREVEVLAVYPGNPDAYRKWDGEDTEDTEDAE